MNDPVLLLTILLYRPYTRQLTRAVTSAWKFNQGRIEGLDCLVDCVEPARLYVPAHTQPKPDTRGYNFPCFQIDKKMFKLKKTIIKNMHIFHF